MRQLQLFCETDTERLDREMEQLRRQVDRVRKGQFAKLAHLEQKCADLQGECEFLRSKICKEKMLF